ncbi:3-ketodihydrosphingosine reductase [Copidosoma floridanum]|uniref:3-ketodihydrosphingosine reductase n=1 Tax=Copidosoma floridanum TaxID=29053 RepID=UPI0006C94FD7|nr:3-ketodihydrosphingosine reductase [Copidosoma floridanum]
MDWNTINYYFSSLVILVYGWLSLIILTLSIIVFSYVYESIRRYMKKNINEESRQKGLLYKKNVIVTGGSSGIGKCVAILAAQEGANVIIIARNLEKLTMAQSEILEACRDKKTQQIEGISMDISLDYGRVLTAIDELENRLGPIYMLVNCAGTAVCGKIEDTTSDMFNLLLQLNLAGSYYCTKAVVPKMKQAREGRIVLVGSQASLLGVFGYTAYSATKFAIRGLAEALAMELTPHNVFVTLSLPPDTDTPGFEVEEETKPMETKLISNACGLMQPEDVAKKLFYDALDGKFFSTIGMESYLVTTVCAGMSPYSSLSELALQVLLMGPFRIVSAFLLYSFRNIVTKCMNDRENQKKSE